MRGEGRVRGKEKGERRERQQPSLQKRDRERVQTAGGRRFTGPQRNGGMEVGRACPLRGQGNQLTVQTIIVTSDLAWNCGRGLTLDQWD